MRPVRIEYTSKVDGLKDYYFLHDAGAGTICLVWLHGHGSHGDQPFTRKDVAELLLPMISKYNLSIISPNLRDNAWMSPAAVTDLHDVLAECQSKCRFAKYLFICGSMGGTGALIFAAKYPELAGGLAIKGAATDIWRYREYCRTGTAHQILPELFRAIDQHYAPEDYEAPLFGPNLVIFSNEDLVTPAKVMHEASKKYANLSIKLGIVEGNIVAAEKIKDLAELPPREVLVAQVLGTMQAPISSFVRVLNANITGFVRALDQIREKKEAC